MPSNPKSLPFVIYIQPPFNTPFTQSFYNDITFVDAKSIREPAILPDSALLAPPVFCRDEVASSEIALGPLDHVLQDRELTLMDQKHLRSQYDAGFRSICITYGVQTSFGQPALVHSQKIHFARVRAAFPCH
jgi:hypothetical protein